MTDQIDYPEPAPKKPPGPHAGRYHGTGSKNNPQALPYSEELMLQIKADFVEILAHGFTVDRAVRLLGHWATSPDKHRGIDGVEHDEAHPSYGRAIPSRKTIYTWRDADPEFVEAWDEAYHVRGLEHLEDHALDMAYAGNDKLIMFLLKARNPTKYASFGAMAGGSFQIQITAQDQDL